MRRYDDTVSVQRGQVQRREAPAHFLWRGQLWRVCEIVSHWVETGAWWEHDEVQALLGVEDAASSRVSGVGSGVSMEALLAQREIWRVQAARGRHGHRGVFDLSFDPSSGTWRLIGCQD